MKNIVLVVLYKQDVKHSKTLQSLFEINLEESLLVIWDNSPNCLSEDDFKLLNYHGLNFEYVHTPTNEPLSKIYNQIIEKYINRYSILFLFDQDTHIRQDYFNKMEKAILENTDIALFLPYVICNSVCVSPGYFAFYRGKYTKELKIGRLESKNRIAITSGMALRLVYLQEHSLRFDEGLKFYGIDTQFCLDYALLNPYVYVIDYALEHALSQFAVESRKMKRMRLFSYRRSSLYILKKRSWKAYIMAWCIWSAKISFFYLCPCLLKNKI